MIKELNLKFKIKENPHGIKREMIIFLHIKLKSWVTLNNMETGQLKGILAHLRQRWWF